MLAPDRLVLTPTARLARDRSRTLAEQMSAAGSGAWFPPQVLSFSAWLTALRDDYLLSDDDPRVPISAGQALLIWQGLIDREVFVGEPRVAELAQRAWRLIHEHDLMAPQDWPALWLSEDSRRFRDWAARYREACSRRALIDDWAFAAEVPSLIVEGRISTPETIELDGFDLPLTPLQRNILDACAAAGTRISRRMHHRAIRNNRSSCSTRNPTTNSSAPPAGPGCNSRQTLPRVSPSWCQTSAIGWRTWSARSGRYSIRPRFRCRRPARSPGTSPWADRWRSGPSSPMAWHC